MKVHRESETDRDRERENKYILENRTDLTMTDLSVEEPLNVGVRFAAEGAAKDQFVTLHQLHRQKCFREFGGLFLCPFCADRKA